MGLQTKQKRSAKTFLRTILNLFACQVATPAI